MSGGSGAMPPAGSRGRAPGQRMWGRSWTIVLGLGFGAVHAVI